MMNRLCHSNIQNREQTSPQTTSNQKVASLGASTRKNSFPFGPLLGSALTASIVIAGVITPVSGQTKAPRHICTVRVISEDNPELLSYENNGADLKGLKLRIPRFEGGMIEISFPDAYANALLSAAKRINEADRYQFIQNRLSQAIDIVSSRINTDSQNLPFECPALPEAPKTGSKVQAPASSASFGINTTSCGGDYYFFMPEYGTNELDLQRIRVPITLDLRSGRTWDPASPHLLHIYAEFSAYHLAPFNRASAAQLLRSKISPILAERCRDISPLDRNRALNQLQSKIGESIHSVCASGQLRTDLCGFLGEKPSSKPKPLLPDPFVQP